MPDADESPEYRDTAFSFDWETVEDQLVTAAMGRIDLGVGGFTAIALVLGQAAVTVSVDEAHDQLSLDYGPFHPPADEIWGPLDSLAELVGKPLGWCWEARNHRGYLDGFMIAVGKDVTEGCLTPSRLLLAEGACISVMKVGAP